MARGRVSDFPSEILHETPTYTAEQSRAALNPHVPPSGPHIQEAHGTGLESQDCSDRSLRTSELAASFLVSINTKYPCHLRGSLSLTPFPHPYKGNTEALSSSEHGQQAPCPAI